MSWKQILKIDIDEARRLGDKYAPDEMEEDRRNKDNKKMEENKMILRDVLRRMKETEKTSPNFEDTVKIAEISNCPVVISGGVSSINDIKKTKDLDNKKIEGIIVGKAIYDGDIKLDDLAKEID